MKINDRLRFPHPVLSPFTADFGTFGMSLSIAVEEIPTTSALSLRCAFECEHTQLNSCRAKGLVNSYANIVCLDTYFNEFYPLPSTQTHIEIAPGLLRGATRVRPVCVAAEDIDISEWDGVHPEFSKASCCIAKSSVIGIGDEYLLDVGLDKLRPMESIFRLAKKDSLEEGAIAVDLETQYIRINAAPNLYTTITTLRNLPPTRDVLLNSVYLSATLEVLSLIGEGSESFEDKWWFRVFSARCTQLGVDPKNVDLLHDAQVLLRHPLPRLHRLLDIVE